jgi:hypothetical protein
MSLESDLISEDLQLSPATISEKYTDEEHSVIYPIPEGASCHYYSENGQEYVRLSETDSDGVRSRMKKSLRRLRATLGSM